MRRSGGDKNREKSAGFAVFTLFFRQISWSLHGGRGGGGGRDKVEDRGNGQIITFIRFFGEKKIREEEGTPRRGRTKNGWTAAMNQRGERAAPPDKNIWLIPPTLSVILRVFFCTRL